MASGRALAGRQSLLIFGRQGQDHEVIAVVPQFADVGPVARHQQSISKVQRPIDQPRRQRLTAASNRQHRNVIARGEFEIA